MWVNDDDDALGIRRVEVRRGLLTVHATHELLTKKAAVRVVYNCGVTSNFEVVHGIGGRLYAKTYPVIPENVSALHSRFQRGNTDTATVPDIANRVGRQHSVGAYRSQHRQEVLVQKRVILSRNFNVDSLAHAFLGEWGDYYRVIENYWAWLRRNTNLCLRDICAGGIGVQLRRCIFSRSSPVQKQF